MRIKIFIKISACLLMVCLLSVVSAGAKSKITAQSQFCNDFTAVPMPDSTTLFASFADNKVMVRVFNNPTGFFIQMEAVDEPTQQKLLFNGLTVYVDPTGREKDKYAVIFPSMMSLRQQNARMGLNNQEQQPPVASESNRGDAAQGQPRGPRRPDPLKMVQQINLQGATFDIDGDSRAVGIEWVKLSVTPGGKICYNIKLPYSLFTLKNPNPEWLGIGLLSEFTMPQGMQQGGGMGGPGGGMGGPGGGMGGPGGGMGGPGGGMGGPGGGMGGPGMGQGGSGFRSSMMADMGKPVKGWILVQLAPAGH